MSEEKEQAVGQCLGQVKQILINLEKIGASFLLLAGKRETLEEKMIVSYLGAMGESYAEILSYLYKCLSDGCGAACPQAFEELARINGEIAGEIDALLKMGAFNPNFLEQYFEYDFYANISRKYNFQERLIKISEMLAACPPGSKNQALS